MSTATGTAWVNGTWCSPDEAWVSVFDAGFIGGVAIFDTLACWQGSLFKLNKHLDRFQRSAHAAMVPLRVSGVGLEELVVETTRRSGCKDAYVQMIATPGRRSSPSGQLTGEPTLIVYAVPYIWLAPREKIDTGISVIFPSVRNQATAVNDPKVKNFNRMQSHYARIEADLAGADDVILLDERGNLTESRGANVFVVRDGVLCTPSGGVLEGITRETVFEIADSLNVRAVECDLTPFDVYVADEAFLCSTAGGIFPIVRAQGREVGNGSPGDLTRQITSIYWDRHLGGPDTTSLFAEAETSRKAANSQC